MAATTSQGKSFAGFLVGITVAAAGIAGFATGAGKAALVVGAIVLIATCVYFFKVKPEEGNVPEIKQTVALQLAGIALAIVGWLIVLFGLHATAGVGGRLALTIVGMVVSLVGILGLLPAAANKSPIWKA